MYRFISIFVTILVMVVFLLVFYFTVNLYFALPVVKFTPDQKIVAVEINGEHFDPLEVEIRDRYIKKYVSFDWKKNNF